MDVRNQSEENGGAGGLPGPGFDQYLRQLIREAVTEALSGSSRAGGPDGRPINRPDPTDQRSAMDRILGGSQPSDNRMAPSERGVEFLDALITKPEAAAFLHVTIRTMEAWMKPGLPFYRIHRSVRFRRRHLLEYLEGKCRVSGARL